MLNEDQSYIGRFWLGSSPDSVFTGILQLPKVSQDGEVRIILDEYEGSDWNQRKDQEIILGKLIGAFSSGSKNSEFGMPKLVTLLGCRSRFYFKSPYFTVERVLENICLNDKDEKVFSGIDIAIDTPNKLFRKTSSEMLSRFEESNFFSTKHSEKDRDLNKFSQTWVEIIDYKGESVSVSLTLSVGISINDEIKNSFATAIRSAANWVISIETNESKELSYFMELVKLFRRWLLQFAFSSVNVLSSEVRLSESSRQRSARNSTIGIYLPWGETSQGYNHHISFFSGISIESALKCFKKWHEKHNNKNFKLVASTISKCQQSTDPVAKLIMLCGIAEALLREFEPEKYDNTAKKSGNGGKVPLKDSLRNISDKAAIDLPQSWLDNISEKTKGGKTKDIIEVLIERTKDCRTMLAHCEVKDQKKEQEAVLSELQVCSMILELWVFIGFIRYLYVDLDKEVCDGIAKFLVDRANTISFTSRML